MIEPLKCALLLALAYFFPYLAVSQVDPWSPTEIDRVIEAIRVCRDRPAVAVSIVQLNDHGGVRKAYSTASGRVDPSCQGTACVKPTSSTRFCIGSITKQFTAALLGTLLEKSPKFQKSKWDTKLEEILLGNSGRFFGGESPAELVTIRDLLAHRMGIPSHDLPLMVVLNRSRTDIAKNIHHLKGVDSSSKWRSSFMYNNWMFILAGYIAEVLGEKPWEQLISEYYLQPIGMQGATFGDRADYAANFALPGRKSENSNTWRTVDSEILQNLAMPAWAAGGICGSADDMTKYLIFLLRQNDTATDRISRRTLRETQEPVVALKRNLLHMEKPKDPVNMVVNMYGMGWSLGVYRDIPFIYHGGAINGYYNAIMLYPQQKLGVYVGTTNELDETMDYSTIFAFWLVDYTLGLTPSWLNVKEACGVYPEKWFADIPPTPTVAPFKLICEIPNRSGIDAFLGNYEHPLFGRVSITYAENRLKWAFGIYGRGSLCQTQPPLTESASFRMQWDENGIYGSQNAELQMHENYNIIHFKRNFNGHVDKLEFVMLEPETHPEFNKIL